MGADGESEVGAGMIAVILSVIHRGPQLSAEDADAVLELFLRYGGSMDRCDRGPFKKHLQEWMNKKEQQP